MRLFREEEKLQMKLDLVQLMDKFIEEQTIDDNELGFIPNELSMRMAEAAFTVLDTVNMVNTFMEEENLLQ